VLVDGRLRTPFTAHLFNDKFRRKTIVLTGKSNAKRINQLKHRGVQVIALNGKNKRVIPVDRILKELGKKGIASLLVEGGQTMYRQFLQRRAVQKIYLFISPKKFNDGIPLFDDVEYSFRIVRKTDRRVGRDRYVEGYISYRKGN
jgi:diaminohydroxyphosphoribosylaminopyrimidine deaminase/5-amino-6-(5-phosphoribosylamino)uracil reductase